MDPPQHYIDKYRVKNPQFVANKVIKEIPYDEILNFAIEDWTTEDRRLLIQVKLEAHGVERFGNELWCSMASILKDGQNSQMLTYAIHKKVKGDRRKALLLLWQNEVLAKPEEFSIVESKS